MKVHVQGFEMSFASNVEMPEIFQLLESGQKKRHKHYGFEYFYYVDVVDEYIVGLVLRLKDEKKSLATSVDGTGELIVDVTELADGQDGTEVSLFCLNPATLRGLFYSYVGSMSSSLFRTIWKEPHDKIKSHKIKDLTEQYSQHGQKDKKKARERAENECSGYLHLKILTTPEDLNSLLNQYHEIEHLEFTSKNAFNKSGKYTPEADFIQKGKVELSFDKKTSKLQQVTNYIKRVFGSGISHDDILRLKGKSASGHELNLIIGENSEDFGTVNFDTYVDTLPEKFWKDYTECEALKKLIYKISNTNAVFGDKPSDASWRLASVATLHKIPLSKEAANG